MLSRRQSSRLRGAKRLSGGGGQSLKLSTKTAVFKKVSLLIGGPSMSMGEAIICDIGDRKVEILKKFENHWSSGSNQI